MNILVACEESQIVCKAFREKGHKAYSCDIIPPSGGYEIWHIQQDVVPLLNGNCEFRTMDGRKHRIRGEWDMILAFPPCTHLTVSGAKHFEKKRKDGRQKKAIEFFGTILNCKCKRVCIENPIGIIGGNYIKEYFPTLCKKYGLPKKPTQIIQPYQYGHPNRKATCLWIKGLSPLTPTKVVEPDIVSYTRKDGRVTTFSKHMTEFPGPGRALRRSKTFEGVAKAMAEQWG